MNNFNFKIYNSVKETAENFFHLLNQFYAQSENGLMDKEKTLNEQGLNIWLCYEIIIPLIDANPELIKEKKMKELYDWGLSFWTLWNERYTKECKDGGCKSCT